MIVGRSNLVEIRIQLDQGVLRVLAMYAALPMRLPRQALVASIFPIGDVVILFKTARAALAPRPPDRPFAVRRPGVRRPGVRRPGVRRLGVRG